MCNIWSQLFCKVRIGSRVTDAGNRRWSNFRSSCLLVEMGILWNQMLFPLDAHRNFQEIGQLRVKNSFPKFRLARNCSFIWPYTLLISQTKWLKDKSFLPKIFLGHTWLGEIYLLKIFFPMSGNGNNPFYPLGEALGRSQRHFLTFLLSLNSKVLYFLKLCPINWS